MRRLGNQKCQAPFIYLYYQPMEYVEKGLDTLGNQP